MLVGLTVKDLALIKYAEVEFGEGLNILTGETGAGKSIIIGSIGLALGAKAKSDIIRKGAESAYVELVFSVKDEKKLKDIEDAGIIPDEDGLIIVSRRISPSRSISRINGETVTLARLKAITSFLIDIHGQHEHQSLLNPQRHLEILDEYIREETAPLKRELKEAWEKYQRDTRRLRDFDMDEDKLLRECDFLKFEIDEIENASVKEGEEEELSEKYRKYSHRKDVVEYVSEAYEILNEAGISGALAKIEDACRYDDGLNPVRDQLFDAESIVGDSLRELSTYADNMEFDEEEFAAIEERLDLIRGIQAKYGNTAKKIEEALCEKKRRLAELSDYDENKKRHERERRKSLERLMELSEMLSEKRKSGAKILTEKIARHLSDLGFNSVFTDMSFEKKDMPDANGFDKAVFIVSLNPGETPKPLNEVASGGELSRVMLAIKTVLADTDDIPTLIFDEIDTGISGRTAQKVSEKLSVISRSHQVICITHLPQIAAMADVHFVIKKTETEGRNVTAIERLTEDESMDELARLLGGARITEAVRTNAGEMKKLAKEVKDRVYL